jgi:hypothetical protein
MLIFLLAVGYFAVLLTIGFDDDFYKWWLVGVEVECKMISKTFLNEKFMSKKQVTTSFSAIPQLTLFSS